MLRVIAPADKAVLQKYEGEEKTDSTNAEHSFHLGSLEFEVASPPAKQRPNARRFEGNHREITTTAPGLFAVPTLSPS